MALFYFSWDRHIGQLRFFFLPLCTSMDDYKSTASVDLGVTDFSE